MNRKSHYVRLSVTSVMHKPSGIIMDFEPAADQTWQGQARAESIPAGKSADELAAIARRIGEFFAEDIEADFDELVIFGGKPWELGDLAHHMVPAIREAVSSDMHDCSDPQDFLTEYCRRHEAKLGKPFEV